MRYGLVILASIVLPSIASAQSPQLEAATRQLDRKDFAAASITLHALVEDRSIVPAIRERAELLLGKTVYAMGFRAGAMGWFERIANAPIHAHRAASARWVAALGEATAHSSTGAVMARLRDLLGHAGLGDATAAAIAYHAARHLAPTDRSEALALLARVTPTSRFHGRARYQAMMLHLQQQDVAAAAEAVGAIESRSSAGARDAAERGGAIEDREVAIDAVVDLDNLGRHLVTRRGDDSLDQALERLARGHSARAAYAALARRRRALEQAHALTGVPDIRVWNALVLATACGRTPLLDLGRAAGEVARDAAVVIDELLASDDNAELHDAVQKVVRQRASRPRDTLVRLVLDHPHTRELGRFIGALQGELDAIKQQPAAWQTSMVAAELLQELIVQLAIAQADLGKHFRQRLLLAREGLRFVDDQLVRSARIEVRATPTPRGFVITDALCQAAIGKRSTGAAAATPALPIARPARGRGCGGCASGSSGSGSSSVIVLVMIVIVGFRRRV